MFADKPTHQATDSMAYFLKGRQILKGILPRKPYNIIPDGDLWEWFAKIVEAKGPQAVRLTKVKGHATDAMVAQGKVKEEHKVGNDFSDEAADIGVEQHGGDFLEASTLFAAKQKEYGTFIKDIHKLILAISKEASSIRNPHAPGINHQVYKNVCKFLDRQLFLPAWALPHPEMTDCIDLKMTNFPLATQSIKATILIASIRKKALKEEISIERQIWVFLATTRWAPAPPCHQGITWLELYVRYTQVGGVTRTTW